VVVKESQDGQGEVTNRLGWFNKSNLKKWNDQGGSRKKILPTGLVGRQNWGGGGNSENSGEQEKAKKAQGNN